MIQEGLSNLALLYIEREFSSNLLECLDEVVQSFAAQHKNSELFCYNKDVGTIVNCIVKLKFDA